MRILVTGGAGYIGSHTVKLLCAAGHKPVVLDDLSNGHERAVAGSPLIVGDFGNASLVRQILRQHSIGSVIHFGAFGYVGESQRDPRKYFHNNVANTLSLLDAMLDEKVMRVVFSSSCATYGLPATLPITEAQPGNPVNNYGLSKLMVEKILQSYGAAYGLQWMALRYFNAAGAAPDGSLGEEHTPETHLIPLLIQAALGQRPEIEIFGTDYPTPDGTAVRDYVHVSDLASAHLKALEYLSAGGKSIALNLGTGWAYSVREVIRAIEVAGGRPVPYRDSPRRDGDPPELVADPALAKRILGWEPAYSTIETIVETAWRWHARSNESKSR